MPNVRAIITTSREPSRRTRSLTKELALLSRRVILLNRGKRTLPELFEAAMASGASILCVVNEKRANPSLLRIYNVGADLLSGAFHRYSLFLVGVKLSREGGSLKSVGALEKAELVIEAPINDERSRLTALALGEVYDARPQTGRREQGVLYIHVRDIEKCTEVYFTTFLDREVRIGPVLRVGEARLVEREVHARI